ncbi:dTDP-4-dehydrorhamnose reductase family protein [Vibrio ziniensis]|uniref:dTDP-4-dehydrorhamnose reductase n=1 Tax=Vibrio ziniensis TaxID=2711221 RepID=A0A6G7CLL7_9VIBR|nr:SDR family oxidoreductase [Vibrio ziniensis]QIH42999.1 SDR family oxidoreductase [Vibrio ziniensis]
MSNAVRIAILGGCGLLGKPLSGFLKSQGYDVFKIARKSIDADYNINVSDNNLLQATLLKIRPDYIINLVAVTSVDECEKNIPLAYKMHVELNDNLKRYCKKHGTRVLHISTDHFYEGNNSTEAELYPQNVYGLTKLMGERAFFECDSVILRVNFFGKSQTEGRSSITDAMLTKVLQGVKIRLFNDVYFSPLSINSLCKYICLVLSNWIPGIYNLGSKNGMNKEEFVIRFLNECGKKQISYESVSINDSDLSAKRPRDMRMDVSLFERTYGCELPSLADELKIVAREYCEE